MPPRLPLATPIFKVWFHRKRYLDARYATDARRSLATAPSDHYMRRMTQKRPPATADDRPAPTPAPPAPATGAAPPRPREIGGPKGPDPTRHGDWEYNGRCTDF
jgi:hypothetical protein